MSLPALLAADLPSLYAAFFDDRSARYIATIGDVVDAADDTASAFAAAFSQLLDMPAEDQRAVRALVTDPGLPDLDPLRKRFRCHVEAQWLGAVPQIEGDHAEAMLWTLVAGLFGLADLVSRDEVPRDAALTIATNLVSAVIPSVGGSDLTPAR